MSTKDLIPAPQATIQRTESFGETSLQMRGETAMAAVQARETAVIQARYIMAIQRPRNLDQFRAELLHECQRPGFAAQAEYNKPVGRKLNDKGRWEQQYAKGPTIRFIEAALRSFRNVHPEVSTAYDAPAMRICRISVTDLEANLTYTTEIQIEKTVERKGSWNEKQGGWEPPKGREILSERINSQGEKTYLVLATPDEVQVKQAALTSKAIRTAAQRLLPGYMVEEAILACRETLATQDAKDPDESKRKILDAFSSLGISPVDLLAYLGHSTDTLAPKEVAQLRSLYTALRDGETTWSEAMSAASLTVSQEDREEFKEKKVADAQAQLAEKESDRKGFRRQSEPPIMDTNLAGEALPASSVAHPSNFVPLTQDQIDADELARIAEPAQSRLTMEGLAAQRDADRAKPKFGRRA